MVWRWLAGDDWVGMAGDGWRWLRMAEDGWRWLGMAWDGWRWLGMAGDGWGWLEMAGDGWGWLEMAGDGWRWLAMAGDCWIEMSGDNWGRGISRWNGIGRESSNGAAGLQKWCRRCCGTGARSTKEGWACKLFEEDRTCPRRERGWARVTAVSDSPDHLSAWCWPRVEKLMPMRLSLSVDDGSAHVM